MLSGPTPDTNYHPLDAAPPYPLWKKIAWGTFILSATAGCIYGLVRFGQSTPDGSPDTATPYYPPYDPDQPSYPPIDGPALTLAEADYVINQGNVKAIYVGNGQNGHLFWAPDLSKNATNTSYIFFPRILAKTLEGARARARQFLEYFNNTFPQLPEARGIWNNIDPLDDHAEQEPYDLDAYDYPHHRLPDAPYAEDPFFVRADIKVLPTTTIPEPEQESAATPQQKLSQHRNSFHHSKKKKLDEISDQEMALSVFAQSDVARKWRP